MKIPKTIPCGICNGFYVLPRPCSASGGVSAGAGRQCGPLHLDPSAAHCAAKAGPPGSMRSACHTQHGARDSTYVGNHGL